jgi:hypothetical protein
MSSCFENSRYFKGKIWQISPKVRPTFSADILSTQPLLYVTPHEECFKISVSLNCHGRSIILLAEGQDWNRDWNIRNYWSLRNETNKCTCLQYVLPHTISYQHVSIAFATVIRAGIQEYSKYSKLPNCAIGTTQRYNTCLKLYVCVCVCVCVCVYIYIYISVLKHFSTLSDT